MVRAAGKPKGPLTLDWSNRQAYALWKDDPVNPAVPLEWQGDVIRARGGRPLDFRRDTLEVRTEWLDGFAAKASRAAGRRPIRKPAPRAADRPSRVSWRATTWKSDAAAGIRKSRSTYGRCPGSQRATSMPSG